MMSGLKNNGHSEAKEAFLFWKRQHATQNMISPLSFNMTVNACLSSQASSASAQRLFSDLERLGNNEAQSLLTRTVEMAEIIRVFVVKEGK